MSEDIHTYIEPELEARITALVLGEVSEFDVEELEQIIADKPELQIFRRRMEAVHELIGEAVNPGKDEDWQLSKDRRAELRRAFASQAEPRQKPSHTVSRAQWRSVIGIAACVAVCLVIFSVMNPLESPRDLFTPEIISYQASSVEDEDENGSSRWYDDSVSSSRSDIHKSETGRMKLLKTELPKEVVEGTPSPLSGDYRSSDSRAEKNLDVSPFDQKPRSGERSQKHGLDDVRSERKREAERVVKRKPAKPGSQMAKVIASNTQSPSSIPVPSPTVPEPSVDLEEVENYSGRKDGWIDSSLSGADMLVDDLSRKRQVTGNDGKVIEGFNYSLNGTIASDVSEIGGITRSGNYAVTRNSIDSDLGAPERGDGLEVNIDNVRRNLHMGEGDYNLGKLAEAEEEFKRVLKVDKYNKAARRGLEKVAATKSDYYRAAYDGTRATLLAEVDKSWEMDVSEDVAPEPLKKRPAASVRLSGKKRGLKLDRQKELAAKGSADIKNNRKKAKSTVPQATEKSTGKQIPAPKRPQPLPEETSTSAQPFSTFSLNVSDVSFKLAKVALLEKGQWPDAAKVRTEEFVNAFDYGDPSPRRGEPVACAIEQSTHPFLQQRNLLRIGMKTAALGRSVPLRLTVLLDNSGSMEREDREASVLAAMRVLAAQLGPQDKITLVSFARQPRLLADRMSGDKAGQLVNIVANTPSEGGTNIEEALRLARTLAKRQHTKGAQDRVVLITDGVANLGNTVPEELSREIETMRQEGIAFDACGVGAEGLNDDILEALTRKGDGRYYFLNRPEDADSGFAKQLAGALSPAAKNVKVQVVFNPKRVSKYRLLGFEKHRLNKEDFRNDKVDAAEMAGEEAGNAVYQISAMPDGEGELGEVFVRFLDTNTGQMVERSWPLTYESQAKRFSEASPAMQLAGTASMLGEKLHGTDAGSVRFSMISNTLGKLRAHYIADSKVQDLIRMCEKVK